VQLQISVGETFFARQYRMTLRLVLIIGLACLGTLFTGCVGPKPAPTDHPLPTPLKPLRYAIVEGDGAASLQELIQAWAAKHGIAAASINPAEADLLILQGTAWPSLASTGQLVPIPASFMDENSPAQWGQLLPAYQSSLPNWGTQKYAVPLTASAFGLVWRKDLFDAAAMSTAKLATYEDVADAALNYTAATKKPAIAALPTEPGKVFQQFAQLAACYDRAPSGGGKAAADGVDYVRRGLSFLIQNETGVVRLDAPAFGEAFRWFARTAPARAQTGDALTQLEAGTAAIAILSLADIARLPKDESGFVDGRYGIGPLPGTRKYFNAKGDAMPVPTPNYVPYTGGCGFVGVVTKSAANQADCWALLAHLASPATQETLLSDPRVGMLPLRKSVKSLDSRTFRRYRLDDARATTLANAIQQQLGLGTLNPALAPKTPAQAEVVRLIGEQVVAAGSGKIAAGEAQRNAIAAWQSQADRTPPDTWKDWRRKAAGQD